VSVLLIRRRRPIGEPRGLAPTRWPFASTIEGTAGAGRLCVALAGMSVPIASVVQAVVDADVSATDLDAVNLEQQFETVALGSHLVNLPDDDVRVAFLRLAARHSMPEAGVLVEHHPLDWLDTAAPTSPTPGADVGMDEVRVDPPFVHAVSTYDFGGHYLRQPFTARVLSDADLDAALAQAELVRARRLNPTWVEARAGRI